jgi:hypothetical protein
LILGCGVVLLFTQFRVLAFYAMLLAAAPFGLAFGMQKKEFWV